MLFSSISALALASSVAASELSSALSNLGNIDPSDTAAQRAWLSSFAALSEAGQHTSWALDDGSFTIPSTLNSAQLALLDSITRADANLTVSGSDFPTATEDFLVGTDADYLTGTDDDYYTGTDDDYYTGTDDDYYTDTQGSVYAPQATNGAGNSTANGTALISSSGDSSHTAGAGSRSSAAAGSSSGSSGSSRGSGSSTAGSGSSSSSAMAGREAPIVAGALLAGLSILLM